MWHIHTPTFNKWHKKKKKTLHILTRGAMRGCGLTSWMVCIDNKIYDIRERNVTTRSEIWTTNIHSLGFWDIREWVTWWKLILRSLGCIPQRKTWPNNTCIPYKLLLLLWFWGLRAHVWRVVQAWSSGSHVAIAGACCYVETELLLPLHSHQQGDLEHMHNKTIKRINDLFTKPEWRPRTTALGQFRLQWRSVLVAVCMFDKFHVTCNPKSKVSRDVFKNKIECQLTSTFYSKMSPQYLAYTIFWKTKFLNDL
jgi:hypothetical protein